MFEMDITAFEKINSGFELNMRNFLIACRLGMLYFGWIWNISVSLLNFGQFLEKAWWFAS